MPVSRPWRSRPSWRRRLMPRNGRTHHDQPSPHRRRDLMVFRQGKRYMCKLFAVRDCADRNGRRWDFGAVGRCRGSWRRSRRLLLQAFPTDAPLWFGRGGSARQPPRTAVAGSAAGRGAWHLRGGYNTITLQVIAYQALPILERRGKTREDDPRLLGQSEGRRGTAPSRSLFRKAWTRV
jgi:hypothetical protein